MNTSVGTITAGELLRTMRVREQMQHEGLVAPAAAVVHATECLVQELSRMSMSEMIRVETYPEPGVLGRYVRVSDGQILAAIPEQASTPLLTPQQAYLAMLEFLSEELRLTGPTHQVHLGGLISEMAIEPSGTSADPGAVLTFRDAVERVLDPAYVQRFEHFKWPPHEA